MEIEIKSVTLDDAEFLFRLMNDKTILTRLNEVPTAKEDWIQAILAWEKDEDEEDYIVRSHGEQAGWFAFNGLADGEVYLKMAAILPKYQHRGIGTYALSRLLGELRERGYTSVSLYTNQDNVNAQRCYQKCGFKTVESFAEEMTDGTVAERYKMVCTL